jgi:hypothetical protein
MERPLLVGALAVLALGACGAREPLPSACVEARPGDVLRSLQHAPHRVALHEGTPISRCVERAVGDAELQVVGATLTATADRLARRIAESDSVAFQLGFLMGAVERGAGRSNGVQGELSARIGQAAGLDGGPQARRGALLRGRSAGRRSG